MTQRQPRHVSSRLGTTAGSGAVSSHFCTDDVANVDMDQRFVGRAGGSIFFSGIENGHVLLALDEATGGFSTITLPLALDDVYNLYVTGRICESSMGTQEP